jgi:CO/xanthine dehydrogenase FAD-binding subunit
MEAWALTLKSRWCRRRAPSYRTFELYCRHRKTVLRDDEILTAIVFPRKSFAGASVLFNSARRFLATWVVAVTIEQDATVRVRQARIAVGSCSPVAQRHWSVPSLENARTLASVMLLWKRIRTERQTEIRG